MDRVFAVGQFRIDTEGRRFYIRDKSLMLRNKEFCLLDYFLRNHGKVLTRGRILEEVWDRNLFCSTNTVDVHVSVLRQKLRKLSKKNFIKTVHCIGYLFEI